MRDTSKVATWRLWLFLTATSAAVAGVFCFPRWPQDVHRRQNASKVARHIKATAFFNKIENRVFSTILLGAVGEHTQGLRGNFAGI